MTFNSDELIIKDDSIEEQLRTRKIFEILKNRAINNETLSENEKNFFCQGVKLSHLNDGKLDDYDCCSNYKFKMTYLAYCYDLSGLGSYQKFKDTSFYNPGKKEIKNDIDYLKKAAYDWQKIINKTNHKDELLNQISTETRLNLKLIEKTKRKLFFRKEKTKYIVEMRSKLLYSKYLHCMALEIFEMFDKKDFILYLNGEKIEINEYSIVHILSRHYSQIIQPNSMKSFHIDEFIPRFLNKQLQEIFDCIDNSNLMKGIPINKIAFKYNDIDYMIWINKKTKQLKGKGNIEYNRLETFYPIKEQEEINDLNVNFKLEKIKNGLSLYVKK